MSFGNDRRKHLDPLPRRVFAADCVPGYLHNEQVSSHNVPARECTGCRTVSATMVGSTRVLQVWALTRYAVVSTNSASFAFRNDSWNHPRKTIPVIQTITAAMQQNDGREFLPIFCATIKASVNDVVFCKLTRSRRWESEMDFRFEFQFGRFAVGGNEIRPI